MTGVILALTTWLIMLTACGESQRSLPVIHAAVSAAQTTGPSKADIPDPPQHSFQSFAMDEIDKQVPKQLCYPFIKERPRPQRADAVQARLQQADRMTEAFDSDLLTVDLIGDHANILSLEFPVVWPDEESYADRVSSAMEDYFSSPDTEDYMCNSGFAEVRLSAKDINDGQIHAIWKAQVTSEGLVKIQDSGNVRSRSASALAYR
ncbi:MAG TPA: hypothetical protein VFE27_21970 [Acidobacteriaceae bacterium]|jgi:hypothetical protein|nr:hypothetical protein [Acidobacteriaceae bacterium]